jgi:predicted nucleic acid-binding protein
MTLFCVDTSAWHHSASPAVALAWRRHLEADELAVCDQVLTSAACTIAA